MQSGCLEHMRSFFYLALNEKVSDVGLKFSRVLIVREEAVGNDLQLGTVDAEVPV